VERILEIFYVLGGVKRKMIRGKRERKE